ncbi:YbhB/YbcL family Raf kinase inhibitor-like protein [Spirosoma spitsbergense]|uniref:YbhB/YbcL family Raf kinase inhibitor-like protein n=1 Tax=Spirosoma spitsbergense TaxID=431554 RepID=UPI000367389C|nr:YbhB/YbcL family Raf kinase inhibitor-like protein [Spirosoma spitsbergense]
MRTVWRILLGFVLFVILVLVGMHFWAGSGRNQEEQKLVALNKYIHVSSRSFPPAGDMPISCSCKGEERSPEISWDNVPITATSFVILATDYDVPTPAFSIFNLSHWVVYNLPTAVRSLPDGVTPAQMNALGGKVGKNSLGNSTFIGPCPPLGRHAYVFRVYALDEMLSFPTVPDKQAVLNAMEGHILGYGELTGYFQ